MSSCMVPRRNWYRSSSWEAATSPGLCARRAHLFPPQQRDRDDRRRLDWPNVARDRERREHQRALQRRPYSSFSGPVTLATGVAADDIGVVTALPNGQIGVLWSNQNTRLFGFRVHSDGADPSVWSTDEQPASQSALDVGLGMADDHLNVAVAADGTLYAAVKTSYDTAGQTKTRFSSGDRAECGTTCTRSTRPGRVRSSS